MPALTVKNIPDDLYTQLKQAARAHRRSLNSEILYCVEKSLGTHKIDISEHLAVARSLREITAAHPLSDDEIDAVKHEGRA